MLCNINPYKPALKRCQYSLDSTFNIIAPSIWNFCLLHPSVSEMFRFRRWCYKVLFQAANLTVRPLFKQRLSWVPRQHSERLTLRTTRVAAPISNKWLYIDFHIGVFSITLHIYTQVCLRTFIWNENSRRYLITMSPYQL